MRGVPVMGATLTALAKTNSIGSQPIQRRSPNPVVAVTADSIGTCRIKGYQYNVPGGRSWLHRPEAKQQACHDDWPE